MTAGLLGHKIFELDRDQAVNIFHVGNLLPMVVDSFAIRRWLFGGAGAMRASGAITVGSKNNGKEHSNLTCAWAGRILRLRADPYQGSRRYSGRSCELMINQ